MSKRLRLGIFIAVCLVQLAAVSAAIWKHERALSLGAPYRFALMPVDPVDPFRGRYVALRFEASDLPSNVQLPHGTGPVYASLSIDPAGNAYVSSLDSEPPTGAHYLRLNAFWSDHVELPFDRFYAKEATAKHMEELARRQPMPVSFATVRVLNGHGVIESVTIGDEEFR